MLLMTALAGFIGWMSHHTILKVYDETVRILASQGKPAPANPFDAKPELALLSNLAIYVPLIGALLAIVVGHIAMIEDRASGAARLLFSRPMPRSSYVLGKLLGTIIALAGVLTTSAVLSTLSLVIVNGNMPTIGELGRLAVFFLISLAYMLAFALIGMAFAIASRSRSLSIVAALGVWLVLTFVVPQVTSGLRPTTSLNPITDPVSTSQSFFHATAHARPISVSEQYKRVSATALQTAPAEPLTRSAGRVLPIIALAALLTLLVRRLVARHDYSRGLQ
jgi:ABC-type transport system involved in multi-copper enzyme maturation permease subunit